MGRGGVAGRDGGRDKKSIETMVVHNYQAAADTRKLLRIIIGTNEPPIITE